jgi:hypothetical protein
MADMALQYIRAIERFHSNEAFGLRSNVEVASKKDIGRDVTGFWSQVDLTFASVQATSAAVNAYQHVIKKSLDAHEQHRGVSFLSGQIKPAKNLLLEFKADEEVSDTNTRTRTHVTYYRRTYNAGRRRRRSGF